MALQTEQSAFQEQHKSTVLVTGFALQNRLAAYPSILGEGRVRQGEEVALAGPLKALEGGFRGDSLEDSLGQVAARNHSQNLGFVGTQDGHLSCEGMLDLHDAAPGKTSVPTLGCPVISRIRSSAGARPGGLQSG